MLKSGAKKNLDYIINPKNCSAKQPKQVEQDLLFDDAESLQHAKDLEILSCNESIKSSSKKL